jgi:hypothetical protein
MAVTWNAAWEADPDGTENVSSGDDEIREVKTAIEERMANEHWTYVGDSTSGNYLLDFTHRAGAAKAYFQDAAPTNRPNGSTALDSDDAGRIWFDDNDSDTPYFYDGSSWIGLNRTWIRFSIQGTLSTGTAVIPSIPFPRGGKIIGVYAHVDTAPTGAALRIDLEKYDQGADANDGSIFGTNDYVEISAAANDGNSTDMDSSNQEMDASDYLIVDIDQVGSTVAGADLAVTIEVLVGAEGLTP